MSSVAGHGHTVLWSRAELQARGATLEGDDEILPAASSALSGIQGFPSAVSVRGGPTLLTGLEFPRLDDPQRRTDALVSHVSTEFSQNGNYRLERRQQVIDNVSFVPSELPANNNCNIVSLSPFSLDNELQGGPANGAHGEQGNRAPALSPYRAGSREVLGRNGSNSAGGAQNGNPLEDPWRRFRELDTASTVSQSIDHSSSTDDTLPKTTMSYSNFPTSSSAWRTSDSETEKMESSTLRTEDDDTTIQSIESGLDVSNTPLLAYSNPEPPIALETPSTISTAPSTDDASLNLDPSMFFRLEGQQGGHRRVPSWEGLPRQLSHTAHESEHFVQQQQSQSGVWGRGQALPPPPPQQRVASFRSEQQGYPPMAPPHQQRWTHPNHANRPSEGQQPQFLGGRGQQQFNPFQATDRRQVSSYAPPLPPSATPPRVRGGRVPAPGNRFPAHPPQSTAHGNAASGGGPRSSSEVLKTLLRKKACLYEPDTSRAVTLITWLVGRRLALENGFFSRQQLQAGVHSCVAAKIDTGVITRTKVNRCMQIILNSCFHYIIPRPDGTEESGESFSCAFSKEVTNDEMLLKQLPAPWNNLAITKEAILRATLADASKTSSPTSTPQTSPCVTSMNATESPVSTVSAEKEEAKRAVLLCFNENVRSAEDVFRCHNEFIRDTAHASHLQLSAREWRHFFGREGSPTWGTVGIPLSHVEGKDRPEAVGVMSTKEVGKFRTTWCAKRYDHNHELCGFAHSEVNGGWLRRDPSIHVYCDVMCPHVSKMSQEGAGAKVLVLNECAMGVRCGKCHSLEEVLYHPKRYKTRPCASANKTGSCQHGDICPFFHSIENYRFPKKPDSRSPRRTAAQGAKAAPSIPIGAPILFANPAPLSSFEEHLLTPGLRNLYRRHCSVTRALIRDEQPSNYTNFGESRGDDPTSP